MKQVPAATLVFTFCVCNVIAWKRTRKPIFCL